MRAGATRLLPPSEEQARTPLWSSATVCGCCWLTAEGPAVLPPLVVMFAAAGGFGALCGKAGPTVWKGTQSAVPRAHAYDEMA